MTKTIELIGARGGQGTTTVAAALALLHAGHGPTTLVTKDPAATAALVGVPLGLEDEWAQVTSTLRLDPRCPVDRIDDGSVVVVDRGRLEQRAAEEPEDGRCVSTEPVRYVVLRGPCYVALATLLAAPARRFDGVIVVAEDGRSLTTKDVHDVLGIPVVATVTAARRVARTIDAGLLVSRLHRMHEFHQLRALAPPPPTPDRAPPKLDTDLLLPKLGNRNALARCRVDPSQRHVWGVWKRVRRPRDVEHRPAQPRCRGLLPRRSREFGGGLLHRAW
jgi:hypothetical protein